MLFIEITKGPLQDTLFLHKSKNPHCGGKWGYWPRHAKRADGAQAKIVEKLRSEAPADRK